MRQGLSGVDLNRPARTAAVITAIAAVVIAAAFAAARHPVPGGALAIGLVMGSINGFAIGHSVQLPLPFLASSLFRLMTMSIIGVAVGFAFGVSNIWLVILGLGVAQIVLALTAARQLARKP